jgi:hypothetical protein
MGLKSFSVTFEEVSSGTLSGFTKITATGQKTGSKKKFEVVDHVATSRLEMLGLEFPFRLAVSKLKKKAGI